MSSWVSVKGVRLRQLVCRLVFFRTFLYLLLALLLALLAALALFRASR